MLLVDIHCRLVLDEMELAGMEKKEMEKLKKCWTYTNHKN